MPIELLADVGPPAGLTFALQAGFIIAGTFMIPGLVLLGLWLKRRRRNEPPP
jgi:hypothetical protein